MKSLLKPTGNLKKIIGVEANRIIEQCVDKNFKLVPIALHRMGFGIKRIQRFTEIYNEVMKEYKKYDFEGIFEHELEQEYAEFDMDPEYYTSTHVPYNERQRRVSAKKKPVSVVEAARMQKQLMAMQEHLKREG